eukprot:m.330188 g.330188  ORF g.330188 m.330188 type:complete len:72 (+) comp55607_c0_seq1:243-458(+)
MSRGLMKVQAKEKAAKKAAKFNEPTDGIAARAAQLSKVQCSVCKAPMSDLVVYKAHFDAKHPKAPAPAELA